MAFPRKLTFYVLTVSFSVYLLLMLPHFRESTFAYDGFYNIWRARKIFEDPLSIFEPDFMRRFSPLYSFFFFLMDRFFGFNPFVYGLINGSLHMLNAFLLFRFLRRLIGSSEIPAVLTSVFFLFSSTQWGVLWETGQTHRLVSGALSLLSLIFFDRFVVTGKKTCFASSWILFVLSFGFVEDAITLPLLLLAILFLVPRRSIPFTQKIVLTLPFFLVSMTYVCLSFSVNGPQGWRLTIGPHTLVNLLFLIRAFAQFLLIPRPEFIPLSGAPAVLLRLVPAFLICVFALVFGYWKKRQIIDSFPRVSVGRFLIFGIVWMGIASLPYALRPMQGVWQGRYLYLPGMGGAMGVGVILYLVAKSLRGLDRGIPVGIQRFLRGGFLSILFYGLVLNISTTSLMIRKARSGVKAATPEEIPVVFSVTSAIRNELGAPLEIPPSTVLVVEGLPLAPARFKELLATYYASVPEAIVEAEEGRPLTAVPPLKGRRILYLKWEDHHLSVASESASRAILK
jgi:hypothetical protein